MGYLRGPEMTVARPTGDITLLTAQVVRHMEQARLQTTCQFYGGLSFPPPPIAEPRPEAETSV